MKTAEIQRQQSPVAEPVAAADAQFVEQLRKGDADATRRFFEEYYPSVYRYLLWLTERPETAEDLTQETLIRAWRHLDSFEGRSTLRVWLHRIAHREFLRHLRGKRAQTSLEEIPEAVDLRTTEFADKVELRDVIRKLPVAEGEVVILHYLQGYDCEEIAGIVGATVSTVKYRLSAARSHLERELGDGDLPFLNEPAAPMRQWAWLPLDQMHALEGRLRLAGGTAPPGEEPMERREFLRHAALAPAGLMLGEKDVVDERLTKKVTLAFKAAALSDLCAHLAAKSSVKIAAGASVADEKVTIFCEKMPLRDVMRQLSRPFGYTWSRSGTAGDYRYELLQDLRSQLLEEELRNRDRNAALLALEREIEKYRPYLDLSPDEVLARAQTAPPEEKRILESLGGGRPGLGLAWGVTQMYFRLSPQQLAALRAGEELRFSQEPTSGEEVLPPDIARGVLQSLRTWRLQKAEGGYAGADLDDPRGMPLSAVPEARALVNIELKQTELGQFGLDGLVGFYAPASYSRARGPYATGVSQKSFQAENAVLTAKLARDPALRSRVTIQPQPSGDFSTTNEVKRPIPGPTTNMDDSSDSPEPKVTSADVLEALHRVTGLPVISDFYTRLHQTDSVTVPEQPLFDALNRLCDTMRLRWNKDTGAREASTWLQFRSISYHHDRLKEVPNRLLSRWATTRRENGVLPLDDLIEMAGLSDAQLDAKQVAEGIREWWGLPEWELVGNWAVRPNLRFLALLSPTQRQEVQNIRGLQFTKMTLAQQQAFFGRHLPGQPELESLEQLIGTALRVQYTQPGWFEWQPSEWPSLRWAVRSAPDRPEGTWLPVPEIRARTREAVLQAVHQMDPRLRDAVYATIHASHARTLQPGSAPPMPVEAQVVPSQLELATIYIPGTAKNHLIFWRKGHQGVSDLWWD